MQNTVKNPANICQIQTPNSYVHLPTHKKVPWTGEEAGLGLEACTCSNEYLSSKSENVFVFNV